MRLSEIFLKDTTFEISFEFNFDKLLIYILTKIYKNILNF